MSPDQIMDILRGLVNKDDPADLYRTMREIGRGYVLSLRRFGRYDGIISCICVFQGVRKSVHSQGFENEEESSHQADGSP